MKMSPYRTDPKVDYRRLGQLSEEFTQFWSRLHGFYLDAVAGFAFVRNRVERDQAYWQERLKGSDLDSEQFQDTRMFTYSQIFSKDFCTSGIHEATQGEVKSRNSPDGSNFTTLGQLCLVAFYDFREEYLRREYAIAKGHLDRNESKGPVIDECLLKHVRHDLWGDLGLLRNSIVHKNGVASPKVSRCKLIKWFKPGNPISLTPAHMDAIFRALLKYRNELDKEQYPEHYIQIPLT